MFKWTPENLLARLVVRHDAVNCEQDKDREAAWEANWGGECFCTIFGCRITICEGAIVDGAHCTRSEGRLIVRRRTKERVMHEACCILLSPDGLSFQGLLNEICSPGDAEGIAQLMSETFEQAMQAAHLQNTEMWQREKDERCPMKERDAVIKENRMAVERMLALMDPNTRARKHAKIEVEEDEEKTA